MVINQLRVCHIKNPLGYYFKKPCFTWVVEVSTGKRQEIAQIQVALDKEMTEIVFDSGCSAEISSLGYTADMHLHSCTRYYWTVYVIADDGDHVTSAPAWFETGKQDEPWRGIWIKAPFQKNIHPLFYKKFTVVKPVVSARLYVVGLGLYEIEINGKRIGEEYLTPFCNDYDRWVQYQTYDISAQLAVGENAIGALLGNGWYKGRFGYIDKLEQLFGDEMKLLCELHVCYKDGTSTWVCSDESWLCNTSPIVNSSIYDGEEYDARMELPNWSTAWCDTFSFQHSLRATAPKARLMERLSPALVKMHKWHNAKLIITPAGETVIDFMQVMTGWVEFNCNIPFGQQVRLQFGELLQNGNFYNDNLRTAKQEYIYTSNGNTSHVRPHFTFYGFRYIKVSGLQNVDAKSFTAYVIYSDLDETGTITTSNSKVNRLIQNATWGQRGNFLDVPTDCPQRDERMGWSGDAQIFAATACFNMYSPAFYKKYLYDMLLEQRDLSGAVPYVVPNILGKIIEVTGQRGDGHYGSCAWGDAAVVIPWTLYMYYGDKAMLEAQFENMHTWVDYIKRQDDKYCDGKRLWTCGFHFADWLALDNPVEGSNFGGTEGFYVASAYYYYSAMLTAKAARALGRDTEFAYYDQLAKEVKKAIQTKYFTETGRLVIPTQTAMAMALYMDFVPEELRESVVADLKKRLDDRNVHLDTGFIGTYQICPALTENGLGEYAYTLLLNEDFPSWLYEVNMGATTIWERWNSVLPSGLVSDTGMNSMNHYAYGAVLEWMYRYMSGLNPCENSPGFRKARICPYVDNRINRVRAEYASASGKFISAWEKRHDGIAYSITVPFNVEVEFVLVKPAKRVTVNEHVCAKLTQNRRLLLDAGRYEIFAYTD